MNTKSGYNTKSARMIRERFADCPEDAFCAEDIFVYMKDAGAKINITTVYRIIDRLTGDGVLIRFSSDDGKKALYRYVEDGRGCHEHLHLRCRDCGKTVHLDCEYTNEFIEHIAKSHDFKLLCDSSVLYGLCAECREKADNEKH